MSSVDTPVPVATFALLMLVMHVKHLGADFILQCRWMAQGKSRARAWLKPLAAHAGLHGLGTLGIALVVEPTVWWLGLVDFLIHGAIDRGKALAARRWPFPMTDARFWWLIGLDQFLHHVTGIGLVIALILI